MKRMQNNIKEFIEKLREEKKIANNRIENIKKYSRIYRKLLEKRIDDIKNREQQITQDEELILNNGLTKIETAKNEIEAVVKKSSYTNKQSMEIIEKLKKLLELYNNFFDNNLNKLEGKNTFSGFLESKEKLDSKKPEYKEKCFYYNLADFNNNGYTINFDDENDHNSSIKQILDSNDKKITSDNTLIELIYGFKKIINYYNDTNDRINVIYNDVDKIIKEIREKTIGYKKIYNNSIKKIEKEYNNVTKKSVSKETFKKDKIKNEIKKYLGISKESEQNQNIKLFLPNLTNETIEAYKNGTSSKNIEEVVLFLEDFLSEINNTEIDSYLGIKAGEDYDIISQERNEGILISDNDDGKVVFTINDKILNEIEFHTNEKSLYMNDDGKYLLENNEETKWKICDNIARNNFNHFTNKNYENLKKQIQEAQELKDIESFLNNSKYISSINEYYENYATFVNKKLDNYINENKEEYNKLETDKAKIIEVIAKGMKTFLLKNVPESFLKEKKIDWCQDYMIEVEIIQRLG